MKVVSADEMREIDRRAIEEFGIPGIVLMENAGCGAADAIELFAEDSGIEKILIVAGRGNNGGDGFVLARHLVNMGYDCTICLCSEASSIKGDARVNLDTARKMGINILELGEDISALDALLEDSDLLVDALLGTGLSKEVSGLYCNIIEKMNFSGLPIVALDIPSGLDSSSGRPLGIAVEAEMTLTFCLPKTGTIIYPGADYTGELIVVDIGAPYQLLEDASLKTQIVSHEDIEGILFPREAESHKGDYGHVLLIAGSTGKTGAAVLAAQSALRSGAGLLTAAVPASLNPVLEAKLTEAMTEPLPEKEAGFFSQEALDATCSIMEGKSVVALGPGLGRLASTGDFVRGLISKLEIPAVIDADALWHLAEAKNLIKESSVPLVLTPHPGEMARLAGISVQDVQADRIGTARRFAKEHACFVVLKGARTVTATPEGDVYLNTSGNPGMATAGTGDVLCGMLASFLGQGLDPVEAAIAAVWLHGAAGDKAAETKGEAGLIALDLIDTIPEVMRLNEE